MFQTEEKEYTNLYRVLSRYGDVGETTVVFHYEPRWQVRNWSEMSWEGETEAYFSWTVTP